MHAVGVTHRDIQPANLVFDGLQRTRVKLVDFGFATLHVEPTLT